MGPPQQIAPQAPAAAPMAPTQPMPSTNPNQVTTKPRQMPGDGGPGGNIPGIPSDPYVPSAMPGEDPMQSGTFDPTAMGEEGADEQVGGSDDPTSELDADASGKDTNPRVASIATQVLRDNPTIDRREAIRLAARAHHLAAPEGPVRPKGQGEPLEPAAPASPAPRGYDVPGGPVEGYRGWGEQPSPLANGEIPVDGTAWEDRR